LKVISRLILPLALAAVLMFVMAACGTTTPGQEAEPTTPGQEAEPTTPGQEAEPTTPGQEAEPTTPGQEAEPTTPDDYELQLPEEYPAFKSAQQLFVEYEGEDGEAKILQKKGIVFAGFSLFTIFEEEEFFPFKNDAIMPEEGKFYRGFKDEVRRASIGKQWVNDVSAYCAPLPAGMKACSINSRGFSLPVYLHENFVFTNEKWVYTPSHKELANSENRIFVFVAGGPLWGSHKIEGSFIENSDSVIVPDSKLSFFLVDFGGVSHLARIRGAPVWLQRGDDWKLIGMVSGKTNFNVSAVTSFSRVKEALSGKPSE